MERGGGETRAVSAWDEELLASTNEVNDVFGTLVVSDEFLPPRAHDFESEFGNIRDLKIQELLFRCPGRATSAFRVTARHATVDPSSITPITSLTPAAEYSMRVTWVEQSRLDDRLSLTASGVVTCSAQSGLELDVATRVVASDQMSIANLQPLASMIGRP
ncbi:BZ3500_MvSof-1268-A1-R1_Chr6-3g08983 [Microbotryum saponariae]|uniref:BZ3500_MvSof-1268-A1-R1_Chr6-3g08983 protein n=1 Tax=Microbotryum saponariae TaxID=289078 RepID=A0A2X0ME93_9BASI|nr:BZ3500_MvSof-1268-A1-R1_Chr6-3g08983 [Microbotryum saponariae]SDA07585.1 BZ3501_MvSof-1269-A2-R1_Chr6-2g08687 [Microbotryum saponariae]